MAETPTCPHCQLPNCIACRAARYATHLARVLKSFENDRRDVELPPSIARLDSAAHLLLAQSALITLRNLSEGRSELCDAHALSALSPEERAALVHDHVHTPDESARS